MNVRVVPVGPLQVNCYLVACDESKECMVVDPGADAAKLLDLVSTAGEKVDCIVNTHGHFDHIGGNRELVEATGVDLLMHPAAVAVMKNAGRQAAAFGLTVEASPQPDRLLEEGDEIFVGTLTFKVLHVPGHSPGSICLYGHGHLFVGDVLFAGSVGRTDLPGGSHDTLIEGIQGKLWALPDETVVCPGHGPKTTIGREKQHNPFCGAG